MEASALQSHAARQEADGGRAGIHFGMQHQQQHAASRNAATSPPFKSRVSCPEPQIREAPQDTGRLHALAEAGGSRTSAGSSQMQMQHLQHQEQQMQQMLQQLGAYTGRGLNGSQFDLRAGMAPQPEQELRTKHSAPTPDSSSELTLLNRYHPSSNAENPELTMQDLLSILGPRSISGRREETAGSLNPKPSVSPPASGPASSDNCQEPPALRADPSADPSLRPKMSAPLQSSSAEVRRMPPVLVCGEPLADCVNE